MSLHFVLNPKRRHSPLRRWLCRLGTRLGFLNVDYAYVHGLSERLILGKRVSLGMNATFNTSSGTITIGDDTIMGHNCMVITGVHRFVNGKRAILTPGEVDTPETGRDIHIGSGVFIASGAVILGPVKIGDDCVIGAGAVVMKDVESGTMVIGNPARSIMSLKEKS